MRGWLMLLTVASLPWSAPAQSAAAKATITTTSTLVLVPVLVRTAGAQPVFNLQASDFRVTDNGVPQAVQTEEAGREPVELVVLLQTGGAAQRQFANYRALGTMLDTLLGSAAHRVALVTFDSRPEELWNFPKRTDGLASEFADPTTGDGGAAILDAVNYGIDLLQAQPSGRRIILLLSQPQDEGSTTRAEDAVRRLGESNTTIYSVTFSPEKAWLKDQFRGNRHGNPPYQMSPDHPPILGTFDVGTPLSMAAKALRHDTAAELAQLSGGEHLRFGDKNDLERKLMELGNEIPNEYLLSFRPVNPQPGLHRLTVEALKQPASVTVSARSSYWAGEPGGRQ